MKKFYALTLTGLEKIKTNNLNNLFDFLRKADKLNKIGRMRPALQLAGVGKLPLAIIFSLFSLFAYSQNDEVTSVAIPATQTGAIIYGASASATYTVTLTSDGGAADGLADLSLNWSGPVPTGATYSFSPSTPVTIPASSTSTAVTLTITSANGTSAGTYNFTVSSSNNPVIGTDPQTSGTSSFIVTQAPLTITAGNQSKTYGNTLALGTSSFTSTGLQNSETIGSVTLTSTGTPNTAAAGTYPIVPSAATGGTFDPTNYAITYANGTLTVNQALLTITAGDQSKTYGITLALGTSAFTPTGLQNGETIGSVTLTSAGSVNTAAVGTYPIVPSAATGGTFNAANYIITYTNGTLTVNKALLTITANAQGKNYGTNLLLGTSQFTPLGLQNGETIGSVTLTSAGSVNTAAVGTYPIVPSAATGGSFNAANYTITYTNGTLTVNKVTLTITATAQSKVYGTTAVLGTSAFTPTGLKNGETVGSVTLTSTGAVNTAAVGTYSIVPSAATGGTFNAANYNITYTNGVLTVSQATLTITANNGTKAYGTVFTTGAGSTLFTSTGLQNGETIGSITNSSTGAAATAAVGTYSIVPSSATGGSFNAANYSITYTNGTLTVTQATLTITANNGTKAYGAVYTTGAGSTLFTSTGLKNGETIGSITITSTGAPAIAAVGTYPIVPSAATGGSFNAANYSITYTNGTLTVTQITLTITANNGTKAYGTVFPTGAGSIAFTSTGLQNGETIGSITISSTGAPATATVAGSPYPIVPSAATGGTFTAANYNIVYTNGVLTVTKPTLTITANNGTKVYGTVFAIGAGSTAFTSTGLQNGETIGSITIASAGAPANASIAGSPYSIIPSAATGGTFTAANYNIVYTNGTLTVTQATLTITANNGSKVYGTVFTTGSGSTLFTSTGLQNGETIGSITISSTGAVATAAVGTYSIIPSAATGGTFNAANYSITYTNGTLTVTQATLTITANNGTKAYGAVYTTGTGSTLFTSTGLKNGETIGSITISSTGAPATAAVGTYPIIPSAATGGTFNVANYTISYTNGTLTVTKPTLTITANNGTKVYGTVFPTGTGSTAFTSTGLQNGETIGSITISSTGAVNTAAVGTYSIIPSAAIGGTFTASNYNIVYANGTLTVTQSTPTVSLTSNNNPSCFSTAVTGTATVTSVLSNATGSVQFFDGATSLGTIALTGNTASLTSSALTAGSHSITAKYLGDANYTVATSAILNQVVNPAPATTTVSGAGAFCATTTITASNGGDGTMYFEGTTSGGTSTATASTSQTITTSGTYYFRAQSALGCWGVEGSAVVTINPLPSVSLSASPLLICQGGTSTLTATSSGGTTARSGTNSTPVAISASGTSTITSTITIPPGSSINASDITLSINLTHSAAGDLTATLISPSCGSAVIFNRPGGAGNTTNLNAGPFIFNSASATTFIASNAQRNGGTFNASFAGITFPCANAGGTWTLQITDNANFDGGTLNSWSLSLASNYTTVFSGPASIGATTYSGTNNSTATAIVTPPAGSNSYTAVTTDGAGCSSPTSSPVTIVVNPTLTAGTVGTSQTICYNAIPTPFTSITLPTGGNAAYTYQWQSSPDNSTWTNIGSATATTYAPGALTSTTYYRRNATSGVCGTVSSNVITVTVNPNLVAGTVGTSQTICYNTIPNAFTSTTLPTGGTGTYTYQWQSSPNNSTWSDISGATATTYAPGALTATTYYRRNETSGTCGTVSSNVITITVYNNLVAGTVGTSQTICFNTTPASFTNITLPVGGNGSYTYQWQSSPDNATWSNISGATATTYAPGVLTTMTYYRRNETSGTCGTVSSNVIIISINPLPVVSITGPNPICAGFTTTLSPSTGGTWISNNTSVATVNASTGVVTGVATTTGTATFTFTQTSTGCVNTTSALTVNALPTVAPITDGATNICVNSITQFTDATSGGTWSITNGTGSATIDATGTVTGTSPGTVTVNYTYFNGICTNKVTAPLTIDVQPAISPVAGGATAVCENAQTPAFTDAAAGGTWSIINGTGSATVIPLSGVVTGVSAGTVTVLYTTSNGSCTNEAAVSLTVVAAPPVAAITGGVPSVCITSTTPAFMDATPAGIWGIVNGTGSATISTGGVVTPTTAGTVTVTYTITNGTCNNTASKALTIDPIPTVAAIGGGSTGVCVNGTTPAFTDMTTGGTWSVNPGTGTASITSGGIVTGLTPGTVTVVYTVSNTTCSNTATQLLTVNALPVAGAITGASSVCAGSTIALNSNATGTGTLAYTWNSTITTAATVTNAGVVSGIAAGSSAITYTVSDGNGCVSTSLSKAITVNARPAANVTSVNTSVCNGGSTNITGTVTASGAWTLTLSNSNTATGTGNGTFSISVTPAANTTYTISSLTDASCTSIASDLTGSTIVTVNNPPNITSQPADVTACNTTGASIFVGATGTGLTYQWYKGISPGGTIVNNSVNITGATTNILHFNQAGVSDIGDYYAIITGTSPCGSVTSNSAHLDVSGTINISSQPAPQTVCAGTNVTFSVTATTTSGNSLTYQWTKNGINISGATASTYTITGAAVADAGNYAVTITDISTCPTAFSSIAVLTVNPIPTATISGTTTICQGGTSPNITFTNPQALPIIATYNINGGGTTTVNVAANTTATVPALTGTAGTFTYNLVSVAYQAAPTCTNTIPGQSATVTVRATPTASISGTISVCKGSTAPNIIFTNPLPLAITVTYNINGGTNTNINVPANGTNTVAAPTGTSGTFAYNLVSAIYQTAPSCMGTLSGSATVTVIYPVMTSAAIDTICNKSIVGLALTSSIPSTYTWKATTTNGNVTGTSTSPQTGGTISDFLTNTTAAYPYTNGTNTPGLTPRQPVIYQVIPTSTVGGCPGAPQLVTVVVNPVYNATFVTPNDINTLTICDGDVLDPTQNDIDLLSGDYRGSKLLWQYSIGSAGPWSPMVGPFPNNEKSDTFPDPPSVLSPIGSYYFRLLVDACTTDTLVLTKTSTLTINAGPDVTVCESGSPAAITLSGASVGGTASTTVGGTWSIASLNPDNGANRGTLNSTGFNPNMPASGALYTKTYTPPANYAGTITLTLTSNDPDGNGTCVPLTRTRTINVTQAPIISNPSAMSICSGSNTNITLASTIPSTYTMTLGTITGGISGASSIPGNITSINQVLTNPSTTTAGTVTYNITPTPIPPYSGCAAVTSPIVVTVTPAPLITLSKSPITNICQGSTATITATNSGGTLNGTLSGANYVAQQIQSNGASTISSSITLPAGTITAASSITLTMNINHTYQRDLTATLISPSCGTGAIFSTPGGLFTTGSNDLAGNYTFTSTSATNFPDNNDPTTPQTYKATFAGITFPCISAAGNWVLQINDNNNQDGGFLNNWTLTINTNGVYTSVFSGPASISTVTYSGTTNATATAIVTPPAGTNSYTVKTTDANGCMGTSAPIAILVNPTLTLAGGTTTAVCNGSPAIINLTGLVPSSTFNIIYKIGSAGTPVTVSVTSAADGTGTFTTGNLTSANNGQLLYITTLAYPAVAPSDCPQSSTKTVTLAVNPAPTITGGTQAPGGVCPNSSAQINLTGLVANTTSTITYTINGGAPQTATTTVASGTGTASFNTIPLVTGNTTLQITGIAITSATPSCTLTGLTINVPLTVNPIPSLTSTLTPPAVCSGNTFGYTPASSVTGTTYAWARAAVAGISQPASSGTGGISEPLTNTTSSSINVTYVYTLTANGCSNAPGQSVVVSVSPSPTMSSVSLSQTGSACEGSGGTFVLMGLTSNYTATLYYTINNGPLLSVTVTSDGTGKAIFTSANLALSNNGQIIKITGVSGTSCIKSVNIVSLISVNPSPTLTGASQAGVVCAGGPATVNLTGMVANSTNNTITYTINGAAQPSVTGVNADASGNASFNTTILTAVNNGQSLVITSITNAASTCSKTFTVSFTLSVNASSQWLGVNTDWFDIQNWCGGIPTITSNIIIPIVGTSFYPIINTGNGFVNNITIQSGASVTVTGGMLTIHNSITNGGTFDVTNGTVEFNGTSLQTIGGGTFSTNTLRGLVISNTAGVTLSGPLNITDSLTYGVANGILNSNGNLTLKSSIIRTAWLGNMTNHTINGDVTVERYIATGPTGGANHGKSWQLLATSTKGQTINQSWMEGASATNVSSPLPGTPGNPVMNYGTMLTSDRPTAVTSDGFDAYTTPGPSIKVYNASTGLYDGPVNTSVPVYNQKGYFVFVRGDRSVYTSAAAAVPTILRTKGTLFTTDPAHLPPSTSIGVTSFESIGNPYAAPLDMRKITKTPGVEDFIQVWDPRIGGTYNYGVFVTFLFDGTDYRVAVNGTGSYPANGNIYNYIQSGQAFFMQTSPGMSGTVSFSEAAKAGNSFSGTLFTREANGGNGRIVSDPTQSLLRMTLNSINADGSAHEALDGVLEQFGNNFSNDVDSHDARKAFNTGENLSVKTAGKLLVIERRHTIIDNDTIFLNLTGERAQPYQFSFDAQNLNTVATGFVEDAYTKTRTPLNISGNTVVSFKVENIPGSYAPDRFRIVFSPLKVLPVTFTSIKAYKKAKDIDVEWRVDNERNIKQYEIEKSINGTDFSTLTVTKPSGNNGSSAVYVIDDTKPVDGYNYYRVRSVDISGVVSYSTIVKVAIGVIKGNIEIHPNPITDGQIHLQFMNEPAGKYGIRLLNKLGQVISQKQITREDGSSIELIKWDFNLAHGIYNLEVTKPDGSIKDINVLY